MITFQGQTALGATRRENPLHFPWFSSVLSFFYALIVLATQTSGVAGLLLGTMGGVWSSSSSVRIAVVL